MYNETEEILGEAKSFGNPKDESLWFTEYRPGDSGFFALNGGICKASVSSGELRTKEREAASRCLVPNRRTCDKRKAATHRDTLQANASQVPNLHVSSSAKMNGLSGFEETIGGNNVWGHRLTKANDKEEVEFSTKVGRITSSSTQLGKASRVICSYASSARILDQWRTSTGESFALQIICFELFDKAQ